MKKSLIALAVAAGSLATAQAATGTGTTTLYGSIGYASEIAKTGISTDTNSWKDVPKETFDAAKQVAESITDNHWNISKYKSRIGVKGTEPLANGLDAEFKFEVQNKGGDGAGLDGTRDVYVGLKGPTWGGVRIGRQGGTWKLEDYFRTSNPTMGIGDDDQGWGLGRESKTIKFMTPKMGPLSLDARIVADGDNNASKGVDQFDTYLNYEANGLNAGLGYAVRYYIDYDPIALAGTPSRLVVANEGSTELLAAQVGYDNGTFGVFGNAQHRSSAGNAYNLQSKFNMAGNELRAGLGYLDTRDNENDQYTIGVGYEYNLSKRTSTWVEGTYGDWTKGDKDGDFSATVGIRHDF